MHERQKFRPDIEGLRGIAVLIVVAFHAKIWPWRGGFIGVDVFFVLSGYLITSLLLQELESTGTVNLVGFYARRARRLLPAAAVVIAFTVVAGTLLLSPLEQIRYSKTALATTLYVSNFWFINESSDYFAPGTETNPLLHTWSLAVEEQFYLVWPALVWLGFRLFRSRKGLCGWLGGFSILSFAACIWLTRTNQPWAFFGSPARAWEFGVGGIACMIPGSANRYWRSIASWMSLAVLLSAAVSLYPGQAFPGWRALAPALATATLLITGAAGAGKLLAYPILQWFGRLSYSWYLWHWPVLIYAGAVFPRGIRYESALVVVGSLLAAWLTHVAVENPIRFHPGLVKRQVLSLSLAAVLMVLTIGFCLVSHRVSKSEMTARQFLLQAVIDVGEPLNRYHCLSSFRETRLRECTFGDRSANITVVLFGDSHAAHWFPAIERIAQDRKWKVVTLLRSACPTADVPIYNPRLGRVETECAMWRAMALERIVALHPSLIVISNWIGYVDTTNRHEEYRTISASAWREGTRRTIAELDRANLRTVVLHDVPLPKMDVLVCLSRVLAHHWYPQRWCITSRSEALIPEVLEAERAAVAGLKTAEVVDFSDFFCDGSTCKVEEQGEPIYRDQGHLAPAFALKMVPLLSARLPAM